MYRRALEQQNVREEQRVQMREAEGEDDEDYELEPGYTALLTKTVSFHLASANASTFLSHFVLGKSCP